MFHLFQIILGASILGLSGYAHAQNNEVRENYIGARSLAMGGAQIAVVNDETALQANPAGLGKLRDSYGTLIDPEVDAGANISPIYKASAFSDPFDLNNVKDSLDVTRDTHYHVREQIFPSFVVKNFGFGVSARKILDARMNTTGTAMQTFYQDDMSFFLGMNLRLWDGRIKIGALGKGISRIEINKSMDPSATMALDQNAAEGFGVGMDTGLILTAPIVWLPTLSVVARDLGGTAFTAGSGLRMTSQTGVPPAKVEQDSDVALAFFPIHGNSTRSAITFEYQKITEAGKATDKSRYYHFGYEFNYADVLFLRAGMNQRYWTAGVEIASEHAQFQLSSYGEDIGPDGTPEEDRRYVLKFAIRF